MRGRILAKTERNGTRKDREGTGSGSQRRTGNGDLDCHGLPKTEPLAKTDGDGDWGMDCHGLPKTEPLAKTEFRCMRRRKTDINMTQPILQVQNISKSFRVGAMDVPVLRGIDFEISMGDFLVLFGPSGCGKSTLLHTILGLESPTAGKIVFAGKTVFSEMSEDERSDFRKRHVGMVYQQSNWIRSLSVLENVAFPLTLLGADRTTAMGRARQTLELVGMSAWSAYAPMELSSGQQQRVSLARAVVTDPDFIIADEPTGNLDFESGQTLMHLLKYLNEETGKTILMVTHDLEYIGYAKTAIRMRDGVIVEVYSENEREALLSSIRGKRGVEAPVSK